MEATKQVHNKFVSARVTINDVNDCNVVTKYFDWRGTPVGSSSSYCVFAWIGVCCHSFRHGHCIHCPASTQNAPQPQVPDASVVMVAVGGCAFARTCIMAWPFHDFMKQHHQSS